MSRNSRRLYIDNIKNEINSFIISSRQKITTSKNARENNIRYEEEVAKHKNTIKVYKSTLDIQKAALKEWKEIKSKRQKAVKEAVYAGFYSVKNIIPNASQVELAIESDAVRLVTEVRGVPQSICKRDGSAYNSMLAFYSTANLLRMSNFLNFMLMDEALSVVSANKSEEFSKYLPFLAKGMLMILIEQKDEIFVESGDIIEYNFKKIDGVTQIRRI